MISTLVFKVDEWRKRMACKFHKDKSSSSSCEIQDSPSTDHSAGGTQRFLESIAEQPEPAAVQLFEHTIELDKDDLQINYNTHAAEIAHLVDIQLNLASTPASKYSKEETKTLILDELEARNLTDIHFKSDKPLLTQIIDQLLHPNRVDSILPHFYNLNGTDKIVEEMVLSEMPMLGCDEFAEHSAQIARAFCRAMIKWRKSKTLRKLADLWCDAGQKDMGEQRQVLNKFEEVCDAIYTLLVSKLKDLMNEAGFRHQQFVNSITADQAEHSAEWLAKFISFLLCTQPLNQCISTQQFWTEIELACCLHQFEQWLGQEMLHRNYLKDHIAQLQSKDQQRLTTERLKHISIRETAKCVADMKKGINTTFMLLNIRPTNGSKKNKKKTETSSVQAQVEELVIEAEDVCFYLEQFPPTNVREFQEAVIMLLWTDLGVSAHTIFGLKLENLKFHRFSDGCLSMQVECLENSTKHTFEVIQKRSQYSTFDWVLMYLRMRRVLDPDNLGTDKICVKVEYNQQPLFLAEEKDWLVGMTPFNPNSNFMRKVARQMGFPEGSLTWSSFKMGMAKKIFRSLLHTHNSGDLTWKEVEETLILKGFWKNSSVDGFSSLGHTLYKRQFQQWKRGGGNWSVDKCVPYLHESALPCSQFVRPTDKIVEVIGEHMEKHWVEESKAHLTALVNYLKDLDTKSLAQENSLELEATREVLIKEKDAQQALVLYNKCRCAELLNEAKYAMHNHFGSGKKMSECKDLKLSLEGMQKVNPCFLYDLLPLRSPFRDFDMHFWRGNDAIQCFAASCSASFSDVYSLQMHLKQQHLEKDLPLRVVCECANFSTTILEASPIGGEGGNPFEELNDHIRCVHHTDVYCIVCRALRAKPKTPTDIVADDTKECLGNGHLLKLPQSVLVVFEKVDSRCRECVSVACSKYCLADVEWEALVTEQMKTNRGSLTADAFTTKMMRLLDGSRKWEDMDEVPACARKSLRQVFLTFVNEF